LLSLQENSIHITANQKHSPSQGNHLKKSALLTGTPGIRRA